MRSDRPGSLSHKDAVAFVQKWLRFPVQGITTAHRWKISYWDVAVVEAARTCGCDVLLSEDLNTGLDYGGFRVDDPFALPEANY